VQRTPGGVDEPAISGAIAPIANAVFAATGKPILSLPLDQVSLKKA
jgi:CO/xanthine dehydrogenase Mo-binding subunit